MTLIEQFNLAREPWIPVRRHSDGASSLVSLEDAILMSPTFAELSDPSPIVSLSLFRLILAVVYAAYRGPDRISQVESILASGTFEADTIRRYLAAYSDRFFLIGRRPFLQDPSLADELARDREQPLCIEQLRRETAAPKGPTLFDHTLPLRAAMSFGEAARHVVADQLFALRDGRTYSQSPLSSGIVSWATGNNLFETFALNLVPYNAESPIKSVNLTRDAPIWERDAPNPAEVPDGWLDYVTRPYRRLLLVADGGEITAVYRKAGPHLNSAWRAATFDPSLSYRVSDAGTFPIQLKENRALWRDSHAIFQRFWRIDEQSPGWTRLLARMGRQTGVMVSGVSAKDNAITLWRQECVPLTVELLGNQAAATIINDAIHAAEEADRVVLSASELLIAESAQPRLGSTEPRKRDISKEVQRLAASIGARRAYWARLDEPFRRLVVGLAETYSTDRGEASISAWVAAIQAAALDSFERAASALETSGRGYRAAALARPRLRANLAEVLNKLLPEPEEATP